MRITQIFCENAAFYGPVSYTHLDVYKRQLDENGDVNVHHFNGKIMGTGGFVNIVAGSKKVVLCGTLRAGKLLTEIRDGKITIQQEGRFEKLIKNVSSVTFSAKQAEKQKQEVIYITERAVFKLMNGKVVLTEIAPGIDVQTVSYTHLDVYKRQGSC